EEQREVVVLPDARFGHRGDLSVDKVDGERSAHAVRGVRPAPVERERVMEADLARAHDDRSRLDRTPVAEACELRVAIGAEEIARAGYQTPRMARGDDLHRAVAVVDVVERDPRGGERRVRRNR